MHVELTLRAMHEQELVAVLPVSEYPEGTDVRRDDAYEPGYKELVAVLPVFDTPEGENGRRDVLRTRCLGAGSKLIRVRVPTREPRKSGTLRAARTYR